MNARRILAGAWLATLGLGSGSIAPTPAVAQYVDPYAYACPPGYVYYPDYGCVPPGYFFGPPYYPYPGFGLYFFYGDGWGRRWGGGGGGHYYAHPAPHAAPAPHFAVPHGGGGHFGGGRH